MMGEATKDNSVYFSYLDQLREVGPLSLFETAPFLSEAFDLPDITAKRIIVEWERNYAERAALAKAAKMAKKVAAKR